MFAGFMQRYGPAAVQAEYCNYGEPLLNPNTPKLIRLAKTYLARTRLSTNIGVKHFDPEAYVNSGLDYMTISIDGATQSVYEKFRRKGDIETVFKNVRSLIQARKDLKRNTPIVSWQYLAFEHNEHEIDAAIKMAQQLEVDQFVQGSPFDVSADDPTVRPSKLAPRVISFDSDAGLCDRMSQNWNPFPAELQAQIIEDQFDATWISRLAGRGDSSAPDLPASSGHTCHYLYKNIVMDGRGRVLPCCAAPQPDEELVFANAQPRADVFNSEKYQLARLSFANPERYQLALASSGLSKGPFCDKCPWDQEKAQVNTEHVVNYFDAIGHGVFNPASLALLGSW
jgi:hypothetical protein